MDLNYFTVMYWILSLSLAVSPVYGNSPLGIELLMTASGNFSSTRFPATYPSDASKAWIIDSRARVELTFDVFSLQSCRDCSCDYVEVRDGPSFMSPLIGRFCGNRTEPIRVVSSDAYLFVYFKTDSSVSGRGYNARYAHTTKCPTLARQLEGDKDNCHPKQRHTNQDCGELHKVFNEEQECSWYGKTAALKRWEFEFLDGLRFKDCPDCSCEYIEFFDGRNSSSESLGRFCGSTIPDDVLTSGKYVSFIIKAGNTSEVHLKYKATIRGGILAAIIGGSIGGLFLFIGFLWCCCSCCCEERATSTNQHVTVNGRHILELDNKTQQAYVDFLNKH